ncbi:MAG: hypothetical protein ACYTF9_09600, partial [Planctomycetota bacterium]
MNVTTFLDHLQITENPFLAEEAGQDSVFSRVDHDCRHPDFDKILGDLARPATSIVFGERGSGKTAIRLQIESAIAEHNETHPGERCLLIPYDDLNPALDRFSRAHGGRRSSQAVLDEMTLADHVDAMLMAIVPNIVDQLLEENGDQVGPLHIDGGRWRKLLDDSKKRDLLMLQICYDRPDLALPRTDRLRRAARWNRRSQLPLLRFGAIATAALGAAGAAAFLIMQPTELAWAWQACLILLGVLALGLASRFGWMWMRGHSAGRELAKAIRVAHRTPESFRRAVSAVHVDEVRAANLPHRTGDEPRYAMLGRLRSVIRAFGYTSIVVVVDRVDEPTMIGGEMSRMRSFVWPVLSHKFLQQDGVGFKLLLPLELRYQVDREGGEFFRLARLDKQNFIDRLSWTGATLYDVCSARVNACRPPGAEPISLMAMFDDSVT